MTTHHSTQNYADAQEAIKILKLAIYRVLLDAGAKGMKNAEVGRVLGIYAGHEGHEGHIPRTLLGMMQSEGVVEQDQRTKSWRLRMIVSESSEA